MNQLLMAALAAFLAVLVAMPAPAAALERLRARPERRVPAWLEGREGALPLRQRTLLGLAMGALLMLALDGMLGVAGGLVVGLGSVVLLGYRAPRPDTGELAAELPDALGFLRVCLEAGQPMSAAVEAVADVSPPATQKLLREVAAQLALGRAGPEAWARLRQHPVWGQPAADIARAERSGASLSGVLRVHAEDARQDFRDRSLKAARTVGVRSVVPLMACFLPAFMLVGVVPIIAGLIQNFFSG
ncbi:type II secretion system F family protein [Tessaracoccus sp. MC1756]|uniref:type II secretion system F family protein n=1 Tax=Tessaracoccus sp. MC1756 TaxID=2760311 RepID=UPI0016007E0F|nr:type II secretion system F family protein [Tessaracoccus sp. MC1756]MBB1508439.1 type II secretion system F family protein [Tessaracoccus sp. MC1756]